MERNTGSQLELMLLALLRHPAHGYELIERLRAVSGGRLDVPEGTIYPALYRLERSSLLSSSETVVRGRRRRVYRLTDRGLAALEQRRTDWAAETTIIGRILDEGGQRVTS
jgi:PadR family transcriptional regulator